MRVEFLIDCNERDVKANAGDIQTHNRDKGKWLIRHGFAVETEKTTDEQKVIAAATEDDEQPQHYETLYHYEPAPAPPRRTWWDKIKTLWHRQPE